MEYFNSANEVFCTCPFCSPFEEMKVVAKYFMETPIDEIIELYGNDKIHAAHEIYRFGKACNKSPINFYTTLEIISMAADSMGDECPNQVLEILCDQYEKLYENVKDTGISDEIEGDAGKRIIKKLAETTKDEFIVVDDEEIPISIEYDDDSDEEENIYHDAEYYKEKALNFKRKLMKI